MKGYLQVKIIGVILVLCAAWGSKAQNIAGVVYDRDSLNMLNGVNVVNLKTGASVMSNSLGAYIIGASEGDTIVFTLQGYVLQKEIVNKAQKERLQTVLLKRLSYRLEGVEVISDDRVKDSADQRLIYKKTINDAERKPKVRMQNGIVVDGPVSALARKISGKQKKDKKFVQALTQSEQDKYIQTRYNVSKVKSLMSVSDSTASLFIAQNPMPYDFARSAKELEIKAWIREHFRKWKP